MLPLLLSLGNEIIHTFFALEHMLFLQGSPGTEESLAWTLFVIEHLGKRGWCEGLC